MPVIIGDTAGGTDFGEESLVAKPYHRAMSQTFTGCCGLRYNPHHCTQKICMFRYLLYTFYPTAVQIFNSKSVWLKSKATLQGYICGLNKIQ